MLKSFVRVASVVVLLSAGVASVRADDDKPEFKLFTSKGGKFTVEMPGEPEEDIKTSDAVDEYSYQAKLSFFEVFRVKYADLKNVNLKNADPQRVLKLFREGFRKGAKFDDDKEITLGKNKIPGRSYRVEDDKVMIREQMFIVGERIYVVHLVTLNDKEFLDSKAANRFFDSFKIDE